MKNELLVQLSATITKLYNIYILHNNILRIFYLQFLVTHRVARSGGSIAVRFNTRAAGGGTHRGCGGGVGLPCLATLGKAEDLQHAFWTEI